MADTFSDERNDFDDDAPRGHVEPHRGVLILVLGIMGFIVCGFLGVAAWLMGKSDLEKMKRGEMDREGEALTRVGYILGLIETILMLVSVVVGIVAIVLMFLLRLK